MDLELDDIVLLWAEERPRGSSTNEAARKDFVNVPSRSNAARSGPRALGSTIFDKLHDIKVLLASMMGHEDEESLTCTEAFGSVRFRPVMIKTFEFQGIS